MADVKNRGVTPFASSLLYPHLLTSRRDYADEAYVSGMLIC